MEASAARQFSLDPFGLDGPAEPSNPHEPGITRLALMVGAVLDRMTAVDDDAPGDDSGSD